MDNKLMHKDLTNAWTSTVSLLHFYLTHICYRGAHSVPCLQLTSDHEGEAILTLMRELSMQSK
jgi:hypothetical protein